MMMSLSQVDPVDQVGCRGNMMLCRLSGATVVACPREEGKTDNDDVLRISALMEGHIDIMRYYLLYCSTEPEVLKSNSEVHSTVSVQDY